MRWTLSSLLFVVATAGWAAEAPIVRAEIDPPSLLVGDTARLRVTVLVPTWFPEPPAFPDFELAGVITRRPPDASFPTSERIGGDTWSGIVRDYTLTPMSAARYRIDEAEVDVTWAIPGAAAGRRRVPVPALSFEAAVPAGAENLDPYLAGRDLRLAFTIDGERERIEIGDALVLRYVAELEGTPALFLPPIAPGIEQAGLAVYRDAAAIDDGPPARREESITIVFEGGGRFEIPAARYRYWDVTAGEIRTVATDALVLEVAPQAAAERTTDARALNQWPVILAIALLALLLARLTMPKLLRGFAAYRTRYRASERGAWRRLENTFAEGDPAAAERALLLWTTKLEPSIDGRALARQFGDEALYGLLEELARASFGTDTGGTPDLRHLRAALRHARRRYRRAQRGGRSSALAPLNPR